MNHLRFGALLVLLVLVGLVKADTPQSFSQAPNTWVKRSPLEGGPSSPAMGYETSLGYDPQAHLIIRWGGHNQGGGGEQNAETWTFDPLTAKWSLREPNTAPPGVCCAQQNVFDPVQNRFLRFAAFSGNHGWQWFREIYLSNSSVWGYDGAQNSWRDMRPLPAPRTGPLRCASWDSDHQVAVVFAGEGIQEGTVVYDPYTNAWTHMQPKTQPEFRSGGNMAYDAVRKLHILFGSQFTDDPHTWAYDLRTNTWRDLKPALQPPSNRNDAVLAYDAVNRVLVAVVRVIDRADKDEIVQGHLETWVYDAGRNAWTAMKPLREPDGKANRRRVMVAVPDQNLIVIEAYINPAERVPGAVREQQVWTYRYADAKAGPALLPTGNVRVATSAHAAAVTWQASASPNVSKYVIYRGEGNQLWRADLQPLGWVDETQTAFRDSKVKPGTVYFYAVRAVSRAGQESSASVKVRTQPRLVEQAVVSVSSPTAATLSWTAPPGQEDLAGYYVERAPVEVFSDDQILRLKKDTPPLPEPTIGAVAAIGKFTCLTKELVKGTTFTDRSLDLSRPHHIEGELAYRHRFRPDQLDPKGKPYRHAVYAYRIRAVNNLGVEGGPSPYFLTIPSAPEWLFSREDGERSQLKWAANPEKGLLGYRIYRMEGPRTNGPGQPVSRLNLEPIPETHYSDDRAGKDTRRYWVVAVDALGQEGFPSAPAWHNREYRRYYQPFIGDWHQ